MGISAFMKTLDTRYLIVSNRLPVTVAKSETGTLELHASTGGLATALSHVHGNKGSRWIGWPGDTSQLEEGACGELDQQLRGKGMIPVHLSADEVDGFYEGFCNGVLWPLFHYLLDKVRLDAWQDWEIYRTANEKFADAVVAAYQPGDVIWVQDYHLLLLPALLRNRLPDASIGFFLHIPFPASGVFRILPWRKEILNGLLGADLIGFHTHAYQRHFRESLLRLSGLDCRVDMIMHEGRLVRVGAFPISIDVNHFSVASTRPVVKEAADRLRLQNEGCKILLGVDRLDYTKGLRRRIMAVERLLERTPGLIGQFKLLQVAAPSRTKVEAYQKLRRELDELVGRVNGRFSTVNWSPVQYLFQSMGEDELLPLYRAADVMVVTPTRDGMNLVAKEFIASREDEDGVLILSEFAGAAWELGEALLVNPYDVDEIAQNLEAALIMSQEERRFRMRRLRSHVQSWTVFDWVNAFDRAFMQTIEANRNLRETKILPSFEVTRMREASRLTLVLDYDGTLVPFAAVPDQAAPSSELLNLLERLAARPDTEVHIASGRSSETLGRWLSHLNVHLWAEHGFWRRSPGDREWTATSSLDQSWRERAREIMQEFAARTPGAFVEEKDASLCWHFRRCEPHFAERQERELRLHLADLFNNQPVEVLRGNKVVELRQLGVHKGTIISSIQAESVDRPALIAVFGDDTTDEDMFAQLQDAGISIHVGSLASKAKFRLVGPMAVRGVLEQLAEAEIPSEKKRCGAAPSQKLADGFTKTRKFLSPVGKNT